MVNGYHVVLETYVLLSVINAFLGVGTELYQQSQPTDSLRSPFTSFPLGNDFEGLDTTGLTANLTNPSLTNGTSIPWVSNAIADFSATIDILLEFTSFFTFGFIDDLLTGFGFPDNFMILIAAPMLFYIAYMTLVLITNRLSS